MQTPSNVYAAMPSQIDDIRSLTAAIASGSTEAFATFYDAWFDRCVRSVRSMTGFDEATSLDIVQDAMLKAATSMPRFNEERQLSAWMNRVMLNAARDRIRSSTRRQRREDAYEPHATERMSDDDLAELMHKMNRLDEEQKALLHARFSFGWTLQRIAESIGLGAGAVDGRIKRALNQLRDDFERDYQKEVKND